MPRTHTTRRTHAVLLACGLLLAASLLGAGAGPAGSATTPPAPPVGCDLPDCHAAIAFDPTSGWWSKARNYPTRAAAHRSAREGCREHTGRDGRCRVIRVTSGATCIGAAMRVKGGDVVAHDTALRSGYRAALSAAEGKLSGPERQRHLIAGVCNG